MLGELGEVRFGKVKLGEVSFDVEVRLGELRSVKVR